MNIAFVVTPKENGNYLDYSSSAGIFYWASKFIIEEKRGVAFGATLENGKVFHIGVDNMNDLLPLLGSKYVRSNLRSTFVECYNYLIEGRHVLFSGTPCQINALFYFLEKKGFSDYSRLITMDIICHGTPQPKFFEQYLKEKRVKVNGFKMNMRYKKNGWGGIMIKENSKIISSDNHPYYRLFLDNYTLCSSCFNCKFKGENRRASFTIGDAWGFENYSNLPLNKKGMSLLIIREGYSQELFKYLKKNMNLEEVNFQKAISYNTAYSESVKRKADHDFIVKSIEKEGLIKTFNKKYSNGLFYKFKKNVKFFLSRILSIHREYRKPKKVKNNYIGIVTNYSFNKYNFGNRLQNFALCTYIKEKGFKPINVLFGKLNGPEYPLRRLYKNIVFNLKQKNTREWFIKQADKKSGIRSAWINDTPKEINKIFMFPKIIYGGDQIWNPCWEPLDIRLGKYCVDTSQIKKESYSPSICVYSSEDRIVDSFKSNLKTFRNISVREDKSQDYLRSIGLESTHVCDPVLLFGKDKWNEYINKYSTKQTPNYEYILAYSLDGNSIDNSKEKIINILDPKSNYYNINHFDFVKLIRDSKLVITDSYHALLFAIIFEKPFILYSRSDSNNGPSRFESVFKTFGIQYVINSGKVFDDWDSISKNKFFIDNSKDYLDIIIKD